MFCSSLVMLSLLAMIAVQGVRTEASPELKDQVAELIDNLDDLVTGVMADGFDTLDNVHKAIEILGDKHLEDGIANITASISNAQDFIAKKSEQAGDIARCTAGKDDQLAIVENSLIGQLTNCINDRRNHALQAVNKDLKTMSAVVRQINAVLTKLAKCLINPVISDCLNNLTNDLTVVLPAVTEQIPHIVREVTAMFGTFLTDLFNCNENITVKTTFQVHDIIEDVDQCTEELLASSTAR